MKKVLFTQSNNRGHWVGDGFPVRTIFNYHEVGQEISPFLMMDYAGPTEFPPTKKRRGVDSHPHRGFETVTLVYEGQVEHRDSAGGGGVIEANEVQWMTAASGLVHEEKHGKEFSEKGGPFEMVQLWVNLPKKDKMNKPRYQSIKKAAIPEIELPGSAGKIRIIAGDYEGIKGAAKTFSPINMWDMRLNAGSELNLKVPSGHSALLFVLSGSIKTADSHVLQSAEMAIFERETDQLSFSIIEDSKVLFLGGEPLNEPIVGYGPFVMNTQKEIQQAFIDFQEGKMGAISSIEGSDTE